jgi:hypothetical protein
VYFYLADGPEEPLGEEEYWLAAVPRLGESVCVVYTPPEHPNVKHSLYGKVVDLQWTVEKRDDGNQELPDWCIVDIWVEPLPQEEEAQISQNQT